MFTLCPSLMPLRVVVTIAVILVLVACSEGEKEIVSPLIVGQPLPPVVVNSLTGEQHDFSQYRNQVVLLNIWATWCEPCREEMPALQQLSELLSNDNIVVAGLSVDTDHYLVREFLHQYQIDFANYIDGEDRVVETVWRLDAYPQTLILKPGLILVHRAAGYRDWLAPAVIDNLRALARGDDYNFDNNDK